MHTTEMTEKKGFSPVTTLIITAVIVIGLIWVLTGGEKEQQTPTNTATTTVATTTVATSTPVAITDVKYTDAKRQFEFTYTSDWVKTDVVSVGVYKNAPALVPVKELPAMTSAKKSTSEQIKEVVEDRALFIKVREGGSINQIIGAEYGSNIAVESRPMSGRSVARVVHSKTTDPANWQGGSTEAYLIRNSLGDVIIIEANYSTPEIDTESPLRAVMEKVVASFKLQAAGQQLEF